MKKYLRRDPIETRRGKGGGGRVGEGGDEAQRRSLSSDQRGKRVGRVQ